MQTSPRATAEVARPHTAPARGGPGLVHPRLLFPPHIPLFHTHDRAPAPPSPGSRGGQPVKGVLSPTGALASRRQLSARLRGVRVTTAATPPAGRPASAPVAESLSAWHDLGHAPFSYTSPQKHPASAGTLLTSPRSHPKYQLDRYESDCMLPQTSFQRQLFPSTSPPRWYRANAPYRSPRALSADQSDGMRMAEDSEHPGLTQLHEDISGDCGDSGGLSVPERNRVPASREAALESEITRLNDLQLNADLVAAVEVAELGRLASQIAVFALHAIDDHSSRQAADDRLASAQLTLLESEVERLSTALAEADLVRAIAVAEAGHATSEIALLAVELQSKLHSQQ